MPAFTIPDETMKYWLQRHPRRRIEETIRRLEEEIARGRRVRDAVGQINMELERQRYNLEQIRQHIRELNSRIAS